MTVNTTIAEAVKAGDIICLIGHDRQYTIGDIAYRFRQPDMEHPPLYAFGTPVMWVQGQWMVSQLGRPCLHDWQTSVTVLK